MRNGYPHVGVSRLILMVCAWGFLLNGLVPASATAQEITFQVSATVQSVVDPFDGIDDRIDAGDVLTARYTFDAATPPSVVLPETTFYAGAMQCARAEVEGVVFEGTAETDDFDVIVVSDEADVGDGTQDQYQAQMTSAPPDFSVFSALLTTDGPSDAITSLDLPTAPPDPASFTTRDLIIQPFDAQGGVIDARIDALTLAADPLPCNGTADVVQVPGTTDPPRIDGRIDFSEWSGATTRPLAGGEMRFLHDPVRLYVLVNMLDDSTDDPFHAGGFDQLWLHFDVDEDGAITENLDRRYRQESGTGNLRYETYCDDCLFGFHPLAASTFSARGEGFGCFFADGSATLFPFLSCNAHRVWEIGIDLEEIRARADGSARLGYLVQSDSTSVDNFPPDLNDLASYLEIELLGETATGDANEPAVQTGLEVTQAIQDDGNSLDLVADKETVARAFLTTTSSAPARGIVSVAGSRGGVDLPGSPLMRWMTAEQVADSSADTRRSDEDNSANWRLPDSWTHGEVSFSLAMRRPWVLSATGSSPLVVSFVETVTPTYWVVPVNLGTAANPSVPTENFMDRAEAATLEVFPVADIDFVRRPTLVTGNTNSPGLLQDLKELDAQAILAWTLGLLFTGESPFDLPDQIAGLTPRGLCSDPPTCSRTAGGSSDPMWFSGNGRVFWGGPTATSREYVIAHEANHNLDQDSSGTWGRHAPGCGAAGPDPSWPYANDDIQEWGFRSQQPVDGSGPVLVVEDFTPDIMSICQEIDGPVKWISPYRWQALLDNIFAAPSMSAVAGSEWLAATAVEDAYYVRGVVHRDGSGELEPVLTQPGAPDPTPGSGDHTIEVRSCSGELLAERRFSPVFEDVEGEPLSFFSFFYRLPADPNACAVRLVHDETVLAERARTDNAPGVEVVSPNGGESWTGTERAEWAAEDADGDPLTFTLLYSPDDGATWRPVAGEITERFLEVDSTTLPPSQAARLRVIATDGFHTVHDDSDAPFSVAEAPPRVSILDPSPDDAIPAGELVDFRGVARRQDGTEIPGDEYLWLLDGEPIGMGNPVSARVPEGASLLTLRVSEGDGPVGEASVALPEPSRLLALLGALLGLGWFRWKGGGRRGLSAGCGLAGERRFVRG